jgi:hypothetical protein
MKWRETVRNNTILISTCCVIKIALSQYCVVHQNGLGTEEETGKMLHLEYSFIVLKLGRFGQ